MRSVLLQVFMSRVMCLLNVELTPSCHLVDVRASPALFCFLFT